MKINIHESQSVDILKVNFLENQLDLAHEDYNKRKNEIITKLYTIWKNTDIPSVYRDWIRQAATFIVESEMK